MSVTPPETLFGLSRALSEEEAHSLALFLSAAWVAQRARPPAALENDLADLARFFAPTSTGRRLREAVSGLRALDAPRPASLPPEIFLASPSGHGLVTPEGRVTLHLLEEHRGEKPVAFGTDEVAWAYRTVADLYRAWGRDRLVEVLGIRESPLRLPVIAFNLMLLVNGCVGEERGLPIPPDEKLEEELSAVIGPVIDAFVDPLRPNRKRSESFRLRGGWILTETRRHLFDFVSFTTKAIWIRSDRANLLIDRLARELARDKRRARSDVDEAFDALLRAYARARPALASRGVAHERSGDTRAIKKRLLEQFDNLEASRAEQ